VGGDGSTGGRKAGGWRCVNVWARTDAFEDNPVKQLVVPASAFSGVSGEVGALEVQNNYGTWPAASANQPLDRDLLWARLPLGAKPGDTLTRATWNTPSTLVRLSSSEVLETYCKSAEDPGAQQSAGVVVVYRSGLLLGLGCEGLRIFRTVV
jgi:hypothetical protein